MNYQEQANQFAQKHGVKLSILDVKYGKHFHNDKNSRYIFKCKLSRNKKSYTFNFGQNVYSGNTEPTMYDVLTCLQKYDVGDFKDFCGEFGYEENRDSKKVYNAVVKEYNAVERLFGDILEELCEIQ